MFADGDCDLEESPYSVNFSNGVWKGSMAQERKVESYFPLSLHFFPVTHLPCKQTYIFKEHLYEGQGVSE